VRRPVWAGSVPAPADEEAPPSGEPLVSHVSGVGDELYGRALAIVRADGKASAERLQQRLRIGFLRAASLIDRMEQDGILGPPVHNGMRPILGGSSPPRPRTV
jgi:S-DNA-T family DNA segregation ATPase FtsK/SpoIIIE